LRVPAHYADPIIEVINDNKDHVGLGPGNGDKRKVDKKEGFFHGLKFTAIKRVCSPMGMLTNMSSFGSFLQEILRANDFPFGKKFSLGRYV